MAANLQKMGSVNRLPALTKGYITFGTLTRAIRINDNVIKAWSEILKRVSNSKLIINSSDFNHYKNRRMISSKFKEYEVNSKSIGDWLPVPSMGFNEANRYSFGLFSS